MIKTRLINILGKAMDGSSKKHTVISNNIANVNTPGYKKQVVSFHQELEKKVDGSVSLELRRTSDKHLPGNSSFENGDVRVIEEQNTTLRNDGNNVDIDMELAELAENNLYFNSLAELLISQLALLRTSINEGRR